jgi:hypothetical protein
MAKVPVNCSREIPASALPLPMVRRTAVSDDGFDVLDRAARVLPREGFHNCNAALAAALGIFYGGAVQSVGAAEMRSLIHLCSTARGSRRSLTEGRVMSESVDDIYRSAAVLTGKTPYQLRAIGEQIFASMLLHAMHKPAGGVVWTRTVFIGVRGDQLDVEVDVPVRTCPQP